MTPETSTEMPEASEAAPLDDDLDPAARLRRQELERKMREVREFVERREAEEAAERMMQTERDWRDAILDFQKRASAATGLTVDELLRQAEALAAEMPQEFVIRPNRRRWMEDAGAPPLHIENVYDREPIACDALRVIREFMADRTLGFLVLVGGKGTYKTGSACWALSRQSPGFFTKSKKLLDLAFDNKPAYQRLATARVVVFDELGWEKPDRDGHWLATFVDLFDDWYGSLAKVIFTANLGGEDENEQSTVGQSTGNPGEQLTALADFRRRYGERIYDRLRERGRLVEIGGQSQRRRRTQ
jgi:hypothetical protein